MLNMVKGFKVPFPERLESGYQINRNGITVNVDAEDIEGVLQHFIVMHKERLFFILELPSRLYDETEIAPGVIEKAHKEIYYIDGCTQEEALTILSRVGELLYNDGISAFGFGCHESGDEIMRQKYNVMTIFSRNAKQYREFFQAHNIPETDNLITAWETFTEETPGTAEWFEINGRTVYDIPELFKDWGIYHTETREE